MVGQGLRGVLEQDAEGRPVVEQLAGERAGVPTRELGAVDRASLQTEQTPG